MGRKLRPVKQRSCFQEDLYITLDTYQRATLYRSAHIYLCAASERNFWIIFVKVYAAYDIRRHCLLELYYQSIAQLLSNDDDRISTFEEMFLVSLLTIFSIRASLRFVELTIFASSPLWCPPRQLYPYPLSDKLLDK